MTSPIPDVTNGSLVVSNISSGMVNFWMQLASISYATQALFLGSAVLEFGASSTFLKDDRRADQPSFLQIPVESDGTDSEFVWGDVLKGIEEMSHNVTAGLLTLQLGTMSSVCFFDQQVVVYQYCSFALWAPYGVSTALSSCDDLILCFIDGLGRCFGCTRCCRHDNGKKWHWRYHDIIFGYGYFNEEFG